MSNSASNAAVAKESMTNSPDGKSIDTSKKFSEGAQGTRAKKVRVRTAGQTFKK